MMPCGQWTRGQIGALIDSRYPISHPCPHPARFRQQSADPSKAMVAPEYVCGVHIRPALMDNGDSVRKPWIVTRL